MLFTVTQVENGYIIRRYSGKSDYNKTTGEWVATTSEEVLEKAKEILKESKADC